MGAWISRYQKMLSLAIGALLMIAGAAMLFWTNNTAVSAQERIAAANVARMEARMQSRMQGSQAAPDKPIFSAKYAQKQQEQLRYVVIAMMLLGVGFAGYGFLKKEEPR